ncbi:hypothetical protein [Silvimonas soli]|uniref:hypothetical protein n=1 Tax=Silvimonas soli TaxID=2980100 RepID=UPI0024B34BC1|nr:hypothetical protein [Silvimonas soli]
MSHLWINHHAWFSRRHLLLASSPMWSKELPKRRQVALEQLTTDNVVMRLQQLLAERPRGRIGVDTLQLMIGAPWVRYTVLPWQDNLKRDADWQGYARVLLSQQYDVGTETWRVQVAPGPYGRPRLAAALDQGLYQTLVELARTQKLRLTHCEPLLTTAINRHHKQLKGKEFVLVLIEAEHATCVFWRSGWRSAITLPFALVPRPQGEDIAALVRDAAMLVSDFMPKQVYVVSSDIQLSGLQATDFSLQWLGGVHARFAYPADWREPQPGQPVAGQI